METEAIIGRLNWFYSLELNQVELYQLQCKQVRDINLKKTLERVVDIEQGHVENIREKIMALGGTPTAVGDLIAPISGKAAGFITGSLSIITMLKADIILETKAMEDYKEFISTAGSDSDLVQLLWSNLIDEDLHTAWFARKVSELEHRLRETRRRR